MIRNGTPMMAVVTCSHIQSFSSQDASAKNVISIAHDGIATTQDRHLACVNSDVILYCTVRWKPIATPMRNRMAANICQETEKTDSTLKTTSANIAMTIGGFRPIKSASWPHTRLPTSTPAIWTDAIVVGIQSFWSHTKDH